MHERQPHIKSAVQRRKEGKIMEEGTIMLAHGNNKEWGMKQWKKTTGTRITGILAAQADKESKETKRKCTRDNGTEVGHAAKEGRNDNACAR